MHMYYYNHDYSITYMYSDFDNIATAQDFVIIHCLYGYPQGKYIPQKTVLVTSPGDSNVVKTPHHKAVDCTICLEQSHWVKFSAPREV